jgi:hypothetical protein
MGSVWGDAEYEREIARLNEAMKKLTEQNAKLLALAMRVAESGIGFESGGVVTENVIIEARALVRLIGGGE